MAAVTSFNCKMVRSWSGRSNINIRYQGMFFKLCKAGTPVAKQQLFSKMTKNCSSFAISQRSRVLCYADDARSLCAQIKELINSDPQACHQPIEILSRSRAKRPGERARDTKASALKIRHETPVASAFECSLTGDPLILIAYPQTTRENRDKMHSFVLKPSLLKCGAATH